MNSTQIALIKDIENGEWILDRVLPLFQMELQKGVSGDVSRLSLTELALRYYLQVDLTISKSPHFIDPSSFKVENDFQKVGSHVSKVGTSVAFSPEEAKAILATIQNLEKLSPLLSKRFTSVIRSYFRIKNGNFRGGSNPSAFGVFFVGDKFFDLGIDEMSLSFIHELAHQELFLIQLLDRLVCEASDNQLLYAPYQGKSRPPIGRFHSFWALFRMNQNMHIFGGDFKFLSSSLKETFQSLQ